MKSSKNRQAFEMIKELVKVITSAPSLGVGSDVVGAAREVERIANERLSNDCEPEANAA